MRALSASDHTDIVKAVIENFGAILKQLRPTAPQVLEAALRVGAIAPDTKAKIRGVLEAWPTFESAIHRLSHREHRALADLRHHLATAAGLEDVALTCDRCFDGRWVLRSHPGPRRPS